VFYLNFITINLLCRESIIVAIDVVSDDAWVNSVGVSGPTGYTNIMAFLSLTKKATAVLKIDMTKAITKNLKLPAMEDWVVDIIWNVKVQSQPGILFYNKETGFIIPLNPAEYSLEYCLTAMLDQLSRLLVEKGLGEKMAYFQDLFSVIHLFRNNDKSAIAYMTQSKKLIDCWLDPDAKDRVDNSYDLLKRINHDMRKVNGEYQQTRMEEFLKRAKKIDEHYGIITLKPGNDSSPK
jgi:hypothetical protein